MLVHKASTRNLKSVRPRFFAIWTALSVLLSLAAGPLSAASMPAVTMKVVNEHDGTPLSGVVALFRGEASEGTFTGQGGRHALLFAVEAVSDELGELRFPKQDFSSQPFFLNTNYDNPSMLLLKPGYAPRVLYNQRHILPTLADISIWEYDGTTIRMKKATGDELRKEPYEVSIFTNSVRGLDSACTWKRAPLTLITADHMFPHVGNTSSLRTLFMNEALLVQQGCGSPKVFFDKYLRP